MLTTTRDPPRCWGESARDPLRCRSPIAALKKRGKLPAMVAFCVRCRDVLTFSWPSIPACRNAFLSSAFLQAAWIKLPRIHAILDPRHPMNPFISFPLNFGIPGVRRALQVPQNTPVSQLPLIGNAETAFVDFAGTATGSPMSTTSLIQALGHVFDLFPTFDLLSRPAADEG